MPLVASTGPVLVQHRTSTGPVLARNNMFMGLHINEEQPNYLPVNRFHFPHVFNHFGKPGFSVHDGLQCCQHRAGDETKWHVSMEYSDGVVCCMNNKK